ncbi:hypothetical protein H6G89_10965 [Oscillatoria sp. FACHB-1407]|uniref:hypothetical protein n=1 Tax=Oscillatoria sp. FACHB-1407 TaxID=2692847 RepID=UPI00168244D0|nr:hypothetical protein [Oscillatoria sp. FACHB-1407]MBD2461570.1 hypothetical protein [Oscillatoria sp. FACHB-1407]
MVRDKLQQFSRLLIVVGLCGCSQLNFGALGLQLPGSVKPIRDLHSEPNVDSVVSLRGQVGDRIPLIEAQVYQLRDQTGTVWVLTTNPIDQSGGTVAIRGQVRFQSIPLAGREQGEVYIEEIERWVEE